MDIYYKTNTMDLTKIDFTKKENQTFKNWFLLMFQNGYIATFSFATALLTACIVFHDTFYSEGGFYIAMIIPIGMMFIIGYKGFIQFWKDTKKGISR